MDIKNGDMFRQTSDGMDSVVKKIVTSHSTAVFAILVCKHVQNNFMWPRNPACGCPQNRLEIEGQRR